MEIFGISIFSQKWKFLEMEIFGKNGKNLQCLFDTWKFLEISIFLQSWKFLEGDILTPGKNFQKRQLQLLPLLGKSQ